MKTKNITERVESISAARTKKIAKTISPEKPLNFNDWQKHIHGPNHTEELIQSILMVSANLKSINLPVQADLLLNSVEQYRLRQSNANNQKKPLNNN